MGMGSGSGGVPIGGKGVPTVPMGNGSSSPNVAAPSPAQSQTRSQYSQPYQQQYRPPAQQQFSMAAPPRQYVQQPYNLSGAMNTTNLGQQQQMSRPNYQNPTSIAQLQAMYGSRGPSGGEVRSAPVYQPPQQQTQMQMQRQMDNFQPPQQQIIDQAPTREQIENFQRAQREQDQQQQMTGRSNMSLQDVNTARNALGMGNLPQDGGQKPIMSQEQAQAYQQQQQFQQQYFRPQQYQQDPYMNYMRNQQQAMQQQAVQQGGIRQLQQADILSQQQAVQAAQSPEAVAQRAVAQGGSYTPEPFVPQ